MIHTVNHALEPPNKTATKPTAVLIAGAGWSHVAGLPLTRRLFDDSLPIPASKAAQGRFIRVRNAFEAWRQRATDSDAEIFLATLFDGSGPVPWSWAVEYIAARLATPIWGDRIAHKSVRYGQRLTVPTYCETYRSFLRELATSYQVIGVVTTNYDILLERTIRERPVRGWPLPGFHYGGLPRPQSAQGLSQPFSARNDRDRAVPLDGEVPLFKLHGSLNWERSNQQIQIYQDLRPAFKQGGVAAIVPPTPEKEPPTWLTPIWEEAEKRLANASHWIVVGYSLPQYDVAIRELLARAGYRVRQVTIFSPSASETASRWSQVTPNAEIASEPGLNSCVR